MGLNRELSQPCWLEVEHFRAGRYYIINEELRVKYRSSGHRLHFLYPLEGGHKSIHTQYPDGSPPLRKPIQHADS